jgi:DNA polymerase
MILGLAPGETEDIRGQPFVGISGNILNTMLAYTFSTFQATITNTVCCRPIHTPDTTSNSKLWNQNRDPEPSEIKLCHSHIVELLAYYQPSAILTLGEIAQQTSKSLNLKLPTLNLFHPSYIARMAFKLYTIREQAIKLRKWLRTIK